MKKLLLTIMAVGILGSSALAGTLDFYRAGTIQFVSTDDNKNIISFATVFSGLEGGHTYKLYVDGLTSDALACGMFRINLDDGSWDKVSDYFTPLNEGHTTYWVAPTDGLYVMLCVAGQGTSTSLAMIIME